MSRWKSVVSNTLGVSCAEILKSLADETRLKIVELLLDSSRTVRELNSVLRIDETLLSYHLRMLRELNLIEAERNGRYLTYRVAPQLRSKRQGQSLDFGCCRLQFARPD